MAYGRRLSMGITGQALGLVGSLYVDSSVLDEVRRTGRPAAAIVAAVENEEAQRVALQSRGGAFHAQP